MADRDTTAPRGPIAWMAGNSIAANLLMLVLLVGGLVLGMQIKQEVFPEFSMDEISITVSYPGASPEEVEQGIVLAVEQAVQGLDGVKEVTSTSSEGSASIIVEALDGADIQRLSQEIDTEVDRISSFPEEAEDPVVAEVSRKRQVLSLMVYGDQEQMVLRELAEQLREELLAAPGVTQAELAEVSDLQISVEIPQENLRAYSLTLKGIADRLRSESVELPGGGIKTDSGEVLVRMKERRDYGHDFAATPVVTGSEGTQVLLGDIGTVIDGFADTDNITEYDGMPAVRVDVYRVGDQTPVSVSSAAHETLNSFRKRLPDGVNVQVLDDDSVVFEQRMELLLKNGYMGLGLVFVLLALFLEPRLAFWVAMGIPISFLGSLVILPMLGISINMITMFAFLIALGIVVDDAIVAGENIHTMRQQGMPPLKAAVAGARQIAMPITFSVLTNMVTFAPLLFVPGVMGKVMYSIPVVVIAVFAVSLVESLFVLPAHLAHSKDRQPRGLILRLTTLQRRFSEGLMRFIRTRYRPLLDLCVSWRYLCVASGVALLFLCAAYVGSGRLGFTLMPKVESDYAFVTAELPYGSAVEESKRVRDRLLTSAAAVTKQSGGDTLVKGTYSKIGGSGRDISGSHVVKVQVFLTEADVRPITTDEFVRRWRKATGEIPGLETLAFESDRGGPGSGSSLEIELGHSDVETLEAAASELAEALGYFPKVKDIDDGFSPGKEQLDFTLRPEAKSLGLTAQDVAAQVRAAYYGTEVLRQQRGRNEVKVVVRRPESERISEYDLEELMLRTPGGMDVPLRNVVNIDRGRAYTSIKHVNGRRALTVSADVTPRSQTTQVLNEVFAKTLPELMTRYPGLTHEVKGSQGDMTEGVAALMSGLALAMLVVYALLAIPFRSYTQPFIVMTCIPFGAVGAIAGHALMGYSISLTSVLGIVALSGVVVNDSLVFIDFTNQQRRKGHCAHDAVLEAGTARFRPIMLTSLTTFFGLAPMILETSRQARFLIPMAISLGFGVLFATVITLLLVPSLYMILEDVHDAYAGLLRKKEHTPCNPARALRDIHSGGA
ncbi:efflux RND transporter permease subunit [Salidesulfovibrio brasiliensis]